LGLQVAQHVLRGHLYRQPGETSDSPPTEPGIMDLMAEIKLNSDYKRASSAPVWLKGGNVLNGHHGSGRGQQQQQQQDWPEDELGESNIRDLADIQVGLGWDVLCCAMQHTVSEFLGI
jgi:hypothetical protein